MLYILNGFRLAIYGNAEQGLLPSLQSSFTSVACGLVALIIGYNVFRRYQDSFVFYV